MGGVAVGVEEGNDIVRDAVGDGDHVGVGDAEVFGKGAVPIHAHALGEFAPVAVACPAIAAMAADDVAFAADPLANGVMMLIDARP